MSSDLKARVLAAAARTPSPTRTAVKRRNAIIGLVAVVSGLAAFAIFAFHMSEGQLLRLGGDVSSQLHLQRSAWLTVLTAGGAMGMAATAAWLALWRGRSMLGRPRSWLLYTIAVIPAGLLAWKVSTTLAFDYPMVEWPLRHGMRCLSLSLLVAVGPLLAFLATRRSAPAHPALNGATMGVAAGAGAWVVVDLWCPVAFVPHLLLGHVLPLYILAATGALLGHAMLSLRHR